MIRNLEIGNLKIIETGKFYGNMTGVKKFCSPKYCEKEIKMEFLNSRINLGNSYGFDGRKMYSSLQLDKNGSYREIDKDFVKMYPNGTSDIREDILIISNMTPGVAIGYATSDYPVIMAYDKVKKVAAVSHCTESGLENELPIKLINSLRESHLSSPKDIETYISVCAGNSLKYKEWPKFAKDIEFWSEYITRDNKGYYHVDVKRAITNQFKEGLVTNVTSLIIDTIHDPNFYSASLAKKGIDSKDGCNFAGVVFRAKKSLIK